MNKPIVAVILVLIIIAAVVAIVVFRDTAAPDKVDDILDNPKQGIINTETRAPASLSDREWRALEVDKATGYRIGKSGEKLAIGIKCVSCGEIVAPVAIPAAGSGADPKEEIRMHGYKCPVCGKPAYAEGLRPSPEG